MNLVSNERVAELNVDMKALLRWRESIKVGDWVHWHHYAGSYGFLFIRQVTVRKIGKRITVEVPLKDGGTRLTAVKLASLHPANNN